MPDGYQAVEIANFGGLDLRSDPEDGSPVRAIDMGDVDLDRQGRVRQRAGTSKLTSVSGSTYDGLVAFRQAGASVSHVITVDVNTGNLKAFNSFTGASITTFTPTGPALPSALYGAAMIGIPSATQVMYLTTSGADFLTKYDGAAFTNTAVSGGSARHVAVQYPDNRLVLANSGLTTTNSRVVFSGPNTPEVFDLVNDYVDLMPGDGEEIVGMANFRNDLFVFKQSAFWRFYGNSTDSVGGTIFNNTMTRHNLNTPGGRTAGRVVCSGEEGVYFLGADGVYVTTGGAPQKISQALDPLFQTYGKAENFSSFTLNAAEPEVFYAGGKLYLNWYFYNPLSGQGAQVFVYDPDTRQWTFSRMYNGRSAAVRGMCSVVRTSTLKDTPYFLALTGISSGTTRSVIGYRDDTSIYDVDHSVSVGLNGSYRTNYMDFGEPASMKRSREIMIEGSITGGTVALGQNNRVGPVNLESATVTTTPFGSPAAATWPDVNIGQTRVRKSQVGQNFSVQFSGSAGGWVLSRVVFHVDSARPAGVRLLT